MIIDIITLFPETVGDVLSESIIGRAQERGYVRINCHQLRDYTKNRQKQVDDYPYGGGKGMILQADPLYNCWEHICKTAGGPVYTVLMSAQGNTFRQRDALRLRDKGRLILVCGHYEGVDERFIEECVDEEISLGDFVLTGGEIPALAVADAVCRLVPGVLADESCFLEESHFSGLLEYPQYSRPEIWHGRAVPPVLLSGHHVNIARWRRKESLRRTMLRRSDMMAEFRPDKEDIKLIKEIESEMSIDDARDSEA
ncbi:MAG: tRNA (guanosine(37)-N1)-methyltransferase TrmD [Clostridiales bacterium]|nr:tRNA (guanosine(37)-N1)-methyltransferase TrmD [Clostridiales bacterium]